jgi:PAS domain S-box-containing protein
MSDSLRNDAAPAPRADVPAAPSSRLGGSQRDRVEQSVEEAVTRYRSLFEFHPDGVYSLDLSARYRSVNPAMTRMTGYATGEVLGAAFEHLVAPHDVERGREMFRRATSGEPASAELAIRRKSGEQIVAHITKVPIFMHGEVVGVYGIATDVTARLRAEETLREANQRLSALFSASPLAVCTLDTEGRVRAWNDAAERMFGWRFEEAAGERPPHVPEPQAEQWSGLITAVLGGQTLTGVELRGRRRDGSVIDISLSAAPLRDARGGASGVIAVMADVTERKLLEQQFRQAQKMDAVGRLAGGIAHDFNNLLTAIQFNCEALLDDLPADNRHRGEVQGTLDAALRAAGLTRQLLAFSRKQIFQAKLLDLSQVVANVEPMLRRLIGEDILVTTALATELGTVEADPNQLEQVLLNLALNARDAMPGGGRLTIETANAELDHGFAQRHGVALSGSDYVVLAVSDTGHGMDEETQAHIFEPFFTTKPQGKGTGLGLSTVYGTVKQSGGYVWVYSEVGRGSVFKVYLPRVSAPAMAAERAADERPRRAAAPQESHEGTETILLVEDEDAVRLVVRRVLTRHGYTVLAASNGHDALRIAESHPGAIDMLVTDVVMPEMGGRELADRLLPLRPAIRVLFTSGYTDDDIVRRGVLLPGTAFLQKPFTTEGIARKVREVLKTR